MEFSGKWIHYIYSLTEYFRREFRAKFRYYWTELYSFFKSAVLSHNDSCVFMQNVKNGKLVAAIAIFLTQNSTNNFVDNDIQLKIKDN